jgi:hypothetical protein
VSTIFNPWTEPAAWRYDFGRLSYSVPDGWTNTEDCGWCYQLAKQGAPSDAGIYVFSDAVPHSQGAKMCQALNESGVGRDARAMTDWLTRLPGLVTTTPQAVTVGGLSGYRVDLSVKSTWTQTCSFMNGQPGVSLLSDANPVNTDGFDWGIAGDGRARYWLLDLGDGRTLIIDIEAANKIDFDALVTDATQVVSTFQFNH